MSFEKVPESSWTGVNSKAGQLLIIKMNAVDQANMYNDIADLMYITLVSEQILEIRDVGVSVYD
jgi:phosphoribosyl-ATP pyrophosphohydrolase